MIPRGYHHALLLLVLSSLVVLSGAGNRRNNHDNKAVQELEENRVPGEYLVTVKEGIGKEYLNKLFAANRVSAVEEISPKLFLVKIEDDPGPSQVYEEYLNDRNIEKIQPNYIYEAESGGRRRMSGG
jgi:hypothetical protein